EKHAKNRENKENKETFLEKYELHLLILGTALFIISLFLKDIKYLYIICSVASYIILGGDVIYKSILNIKGKNFLDENFLMTIATFGAFYLGEITEAVGVMLFYKIGEYFQEMAIDKARYSIESLMGIKSDYANIIDNQGGIKEIPSEDVKIGDIMIVKAGEKIPIDGVIVKGESALDVSALTGESIPMDVFVGSNVLSGSINGNSVIEVQTTKLFEDSAVSKIIEMVENSAIRKAKAEKFITKFAKYYTPIVVGMALVVAFGIPAILGNFRMWFQRGLIFLVISCPCALVISIPLSFFSSIGKASKNGILIKGGNYLEKLTDIDSIILDKTGTLTKGKFKVDKIDCIDCEEEELIYTAKIGEFYSTHPISEAIEKYDSDNKNYKINENDIKDYKEIPGHGTIVNYKDDIVFIGNQKLMNKYEISSDTVDHRGTVLYVAKNKKLLGIVYISDEIKNDSKYTIEKLKSYNLNVYMLTGDNKNIGDSIGMELGINKENIFTQLLPQDKVRKVEEIKNKSKGGVVFVGDGINDAPSLSIADVSIAMGGNGSDLAIESADVVLMRDEPSKIIMLLDIAKYNKKIVIENIIFALGIKAIIMVLGVIGIANMWLAIFADVGVALIAVLNAMRCMIKKDF
ncbi:MAG: heavy metal translocating P-type ATPase, partial [Fusobacteriaceae bacterium]|nr:heavy metal translocating P-type ATPase [Fusobacteriaceae bacterium]